MNTSITANFIFNPCEDLKESYQLIDTEMNYLDLPENESYRTKIKSRSLARFITKVLDRAGSINPCSAYSTRAFTKILGFLESRNTFLEGFHTDLVEHILNEDVKNCDVTSRSNSFYLDIERLDYPIVRVASQFGVKGLLCVWVNGHEDDPSELTFKLKGSRSYITSRFGEVMQKLSKTMSSDMDSKVSDLLCKYYTQVILLRILAAQLERSEEAFGRFSPCIYDLKRTMVIKKDEEYDDIELEPEVELGTFRVPYNTFVVYGGEVGFNLIINDMA